MCGGESATATLDMWRQTSARKGGTPVFGQVYYCPGCPLLSEKKQCILLRQPRRNTAPTSHKCRFRNKVHSFLFLPSFLLTCPQSLILALAMCLMATCSPSLFRTPAYTMPKPPFPNTWPTFEGGKRENCQRGQQPRGRCANRHKKRCPIYKPNMSIPHLKSDI